MRHRRSSRRSTGGASRTRPTRPAGRPRRQPARRSRASADRSPCRRSCWLAPAEVAYQLDDADPALFIVEDEHRALGEAALALATVRPTETLEPGSLREPGSGGPSEGDPLLLIYTSGTTGKPKGALL